MTDKKLHEKIEDVYETLVSHYALGDTPDGKAVASALLDSGILFEVEQEAYARGRADAQEVQA